MTDAEKRLDEIAWRGDEAKGRISGRTARTILAELERLREEIKRLRKSSHALKNWPSCR